MSQEVTTVRAIATRAIAGATLVLASVLIVDATMGIASAEDVLVNGEPITATDIEQRLKFDQLATHREPSRREVIETLVAEKLKLQAAQRSGIDVADSDVDSAYAAMATRMNLTPERLTAALAHAGVDASTLKRRIRADIAWSQLRRGPASPVRLGDPPAPRRKKDDGPSWRE